MVTRKQIGYSDGMERAKKGEIVGACRYCARPLKYAGTGRRPRVCKRKACVRLEWTARNDRRASKRVDSDTVPV